MPLFLWAAFRFGRREVATASAILSGIAVWGTLRGYRAVRRETRSTSRSCCVQAYICVMAVMGVVLAVRRRRAQARRGAAARARDHRSAHRPRELPPADRSAARRDRPFAPHRPAVHRRVRGHGRAQGHQRSATATSSAAARSAASADALRRSSRHARHGGAIWRRRVRHRPAGNERRRRSGACSTRLQIAWRPIRTSRRSRSAAASPCSRATATRRRLLLRTPTARCTQPRPPMPKRGARAVEAKEEDRKTGTS